MLVKFYSRAAADIIMFGDVAEKLIKLMGHSGTIPSAIQAADVPVALQKLEKALAESTTTPVENDADADEEQAFQPSLTQRALPLADLLKRAIAADADVMWDRH